MSDQAYTVIGVDPENPDTHRLIIVRDVTYSVAIGEEQATANEIAANLSR